MYNFYPNSAVRSDMHHLVTVALLTYNRAQYLKESLAAVLDQTYTDIEVLVCNNASQDETADVVKDFRDTRLIHICQSLNKGVVGNYCEAARRAAGKYVLISHDDDIMEPTLVERQIAVLDQDPECIAVCTNVSVIDAVGRLVQPRLLPFQDDKTFNKGDYVKAWVHDQLALPVTSLMYRVKRGRGFINLNKPPLNVGAYGDIYALCQLNLRGRLVLLADPLVRYRQHNQQDSFADDLIDGGVLLHRHLSRLCRRRRMPDLVPLVEGCHLRYRAQQEVVNSPDSLNSPTTLSRKIRALDAKWQAYALDPRVRAECSWSLELLKSYLGIPVANSPNLSPRPATEVPAAYLEAWLALRQAGGFRVSEHLGLEPGSSLAILGSVFNAYLLGLDAHEAGHRVVAFLDSNTGRQGRSLGRVPVVPPLWLQTNRFQVDAILLSSERDRTQGLTAFLRQFIPEDWQGRILSWREAVRAIGSLID
jgi:glycosyltransferase involved in cell wall biosynthesis